MSLMKIQKQTEAEKDSYLVDCFYDAGFIADLINEGHSIVVGRKGTGKTALAKYLENKYSEYGLSFSCRVSIRDHVLDHQSTNSSRLDSLLHFVLVKSVQGILVQDDIFSESSRQYWKDYLAQHGLQNVLDYKEFTLRKITEKGSMGIKVPALISGGINSETESGRSNISNHPSALFDALKQSFPSEKPTIIFIDDVSDHLDEVPDESLHESISLIKDFLFKLDAYNSGFLSAGIGLRFVSLLRDDLFEFMQGSNINKLRTDAYELRWNEKSFAGLLIRRLPFFKDNMELALREPVESIRSLFPDDIFSKHLKDFDTNRYATNFYAYMVATSFNRPRDFLMFCYAMRDRLSMKHRVLPANIESAEIEYSDYFAHELRDELYLASRVLKFDAQTEDLTRLINLLSDDDSFTSSKLRTDLSRYLGDRTSFGKKKTEEFIRQLWWYGIIGFREQREKPIQFKYVPKSAALVIDRIKGYTFFLHRGLRWFAKRS